MKIKVTFEAEIPQATLSETQEWLEYELGARASLKSSPLSFTDLEMIDAKNVQFTIVDADDAINE